MHLEDQAFFRGLINRLDETIRLLALEEQDLISNLGDQRIDELLAFWKRDLSDEEHEAFKITMDDWDKTVIRTWARSKRAHHTRAEARQTLMKFDLML